MTGEFVGFVQDFTPESPHQCDLPMRHTILAAVPYPAASVGAVWRCECGKAWAAVMVQERNEFLPLWERFDKADLDDG